MNSQVVQVVMIEPCFLSLVKKLELFEEHHDRWWYGWVNYDHQSF